MRNSVYYLLMLIVRSYLKVLVAQKEVAEQRRIGIRMIMEESGASRSAIERLLNNTIKQVPLDDLALLCQWVPCTPCDILRLEDQHEKN